MQAEIFLRLPWPISTNTYYRAIRVKKFAKKAVSEKGKIFQDDVLQAVTDQLGGKPQALGGDLWVDVSLYPPSRRVYDLDNHAGKSLFDALTRAGVWEDDRQVCDMHARIYRNDIVKNGECHIRIGQL